MSTAAPELVRYAIVAVAGLAVDLSVALVLAHLLGWPLTGAAVVGFLVALFLNYVLMEFWAFRADTSRFSFSRLVRTLGAALAALAVRAVIVWLLDDRFGSGIVLDTAVLVVAAGASFVANFLLVRLVFTRAEAPDRGPAAGG